MGGRSGGLLCTIQKGSVQCYQEGLRVAVNSLYEFEEHLWWTQMLGWREMSVWSQVGSGKEIELSIPGAVAHMKAKAATNQTG